MRHTLFCIFALAAGSSALSIPSMNLSPFLQQHDLASRQSSCENTATSRGCWGDYSIDTNYYDKFPDTGKTVEYWLSVEEGNCAPDGVSKPCMTFNGTIPGPTIIADWGDNLVVHVTNNMITNGTSVHWHGLRQLNSTEYDGVPGVSQCPIAPGTTMTYQFNVTQYGSTWYHSHFTLQYADGLYGGMVINGPATADYDEDLGMLFLSDWSHSTAFEGWAEHAKTGAPPTLETGLINGTNTYNDGGTKFETVFEQGKKYRLRLVNNAIDGHFQFSIDQHTLTVIGSDMVPLQPYTTDSVLITIGQRYDVIIEANAAGGNYWLRAGWNTNCASNGNAEGMTGIVRYDNSSTADPTSTSSVTTPNSCGDEPYEKLVPHVALDVGTLDHVTDQQLGFTTVNSMFQWTINTSSLVLDWSKPTLQHVLQGESVFPTEYNVFSAESSDSVVDGSSNKWSVLVIEDKTGFGLEHPIHMHGHDFWIVAQTTGTFDGTTTGFNFTNPPRRDVAVLPSSGYLAMAFRLDNPGAWLVHCHIAWHASQGLALEFVESESSISLSSESTKVFDDVCSAWNNWTPNEPFHQDDSGI